MKKIVSVITAGLLVLPSAAQASDLSQWAASNFEMASRSGLVSSNIVENNLQGNITREEFCELIMNLYRTIASNPLVDVELESPFVDCTNTAVVQAYNRGIVSGRTEDTFDPQGYVTRQEMSKMLVNTLKAAEVSVVVLKSEIDALTQEFDDIGDTADWAGIELAIALKYGIICGVDDRSVDPLGYATREQAISLMDRTYSQFAENKISYSAPECTSVYDGFVTSEDVELEWIPIDQAVSYKVILKDHTYEPVQVLETKKTNAAIPADTLVSGTEYTVTIGTVLENGVEVFSNPINFIYKEQNVTTIVPQTQEALSAKEQRVFPGGVYFTSAEEASAHMKTVEVPVWVLKADGTKVSSTRSLTVNENLAEDVVNIFTEIYNDPSQFPIKDVGGYSWRTTAFGSVSQHSYGTCIDINYQENYYCQPDGTAITGKYWKPGEDPYSIEEDGIVVRTFAKYGFLWGGNAWGADGLRDYMHFTYLGK